MGQPRWMTCHVSGICYLRGFCGDMTSHENQELQVLVLLPIDKLVTPRPGQLPLYWNFLFKSKLLETVMCTVLL